MDSYYYSKKETKKFRYTVDGEITTVPDRVVFPIDITVQEKTNSEAMSSAKSFFEKMEAGIKKVDDTIGLNLGSYNEQQKIKIMSKTFGKKDSNYFEARLTFSVYVIFRDESFWNRAAKVSQILDFLREFQNEYRDNASISFNFFEPEYALDDKEKYRAQIVEIIYDRLMVMANVIGKKENKTPVIKEMVLNQEISCTIVNITKAVLRLECYFEVGLKEETKHV